MLFTEWLSVSISTSRPKIFPVFWALQPDPMVSQATRLFSALQRGDAEERIRGTLAAEVGCSALTDQKVRRAWEMLIQPILHDATVTGMVPSELVSSGTQAAASVKYVSTTGRRFEIPTIVNKTDEGPRIDLIYPMLAVAISARGPDAGDLTVVKTRDGVKHYRSRLEAIGIERIQLTPSACLTWDEVESRLSRVHD